MIGKPSPLLQLFFIGLKLSHRHSMCQRVKEVCRNERYQANLECRTGTLSSRRATPWRRGTVAAYYYSAGRALMAPRPSSRTRTEAR